MEQELRITTAALELASSDLIAVESMINIYERSSDKVADKAIYKTSMESYCSLYGISRESVIDDGLVLLNKIWNAIVDTIKSLYAKLGDWVGGDVEDNSNTDVKANESIALDPTLKLKNLKYSVLAEGSGVKGKDKVLAELSTYILDYAKILNAKVSDGKRSIANIDKDDKPLELLESYNSGSMDEPSGIANLVERVSKDTLETKALPDDILKEETAGEVVLFGTDSGFNYRGLVVVVDKLRSAMLHDAYIIDYTLSPLGDRTEVDVLPVDEYNKVIVSLRKDSKSFRDSTKNIIKKGLEDLHSVNKDFKQLNKTVDKSLATGSAVDEDFRRLGSLEVFKTFIKDFQRHNVFLTKGIAFIASDYKAYEGYLASCREVYIQNGYGIDKKGLVVEK